MNLTYTAKNNKIIQNNKIQFNIFIIDLCQKFKPHNCISVPTNECILLDY